MLKQIKNIFFDFDGVILDSVDCKTLAFESMYSKYGQDISDKVKEYHLKHGGISRFEKFKFWHKEYLGYDLSEKEIHELAEDFSKIVFQKVIESNKIPGVMEFLKNNYKKLNFWIITGTPTNEILKIVKLLDLNMFFNGIYGSPEKKNFWTEKIIIKHNLNRNETLFIGDASTDYETALFSSIQFALREAHYNYDYFNKLDVYRFKHFDQIHKELY